MKKIILLLWLFSSVSMAQQTVGLFHNDSAAFQGYTLFAPRSATTTYLIDMQGFLVHKWEHNYTPGHGVYLLENGNLLRATLLPDSNGGNGGFQEIDWEGNILRELIFGQQHHDIEYLPNGNVLMIVNDTKQAAVAIGAGRDPSLVTNNIRSLRLVEVSSDSNTIVWEWYLWDHLIQEYDETKPNYGIIADHPELVDLNFASGSDANWVHTNSVDYNPGLDQILISNRGINEIWIIDHSTSTQEASSHSGGNSGRGGDILYRWGNPASYQAGGEQDQKLFGQHDAQWIEAGLNGAGNILVFNNGLSRPDGNISTVDEFSPPLNGLNYTMEGDSIFGPDTLTWTYRALPDTSFYDTRLSGAQRLPNGNTLICSGVGGRFFEVNAQGRLLWEYINPVDANLAVVQGAVVSDNDVARCYRYGADFSGFTGRDLTAGDVIEKIPAAVKNKIKNGTDFQLFGNYPNPFNPITTISYRLARSANVTVSIYNSLGEKIRVITSSRQPEGLNKISWDGRDTFGHPVAAGIYFYRMQTENFIQTKKMLLIK